MLSTILGLAGKRSIPLARETIPVLPFRFYTLTTHFSAQLPEIHQAVVFLREIEGFSYEEIAEIMECPVGTVRSRIFRARESIDAVVGKLINTE